MMNIILKLKQIAGLSFSGEPTDQGYDSDSETLAVKDLIKVNSDTGFSSNAVVRQISDDEGTYSLGWLNPHYYDPIAVRLFANGSSQWKFADTPDKQGQWRDDFDSNSLSPRVLEVLKKHKKPLFLINRTTEPASGYKIQPA